MPLPFPSAQQIPAVHIAEQADLLSTVFSHAVRSCLVPLMIARDAEKTLHRLNERKKKEEYRNERI